MCAIVFEVHVAICYTKIDVDFDYKSMSKEKELICKIVQNCSMLSRGLFRCVI